MKLDDVYNNKTLSFYLRQEVDGLAEVLRKRQFFQAALLAWEWICPRMTYPSDRTLLPVLMTPAKAFRQVVGCLGGVWCGGAARLFAGMLRAIGVPATTFAYGYANGLSHEVAIVAAPKREAFYLLDAYLGARFVDQGTSVALTFHELLARILDGQHETVRMVSREYERPYVTAVGEDPMFRGWLFPNEVIPEPEMRQSRAIYPGAVMNRDKLFAAMKHGQLVISPFGKLAEEKRGDSLLEHFMLDLMLVNPCFDRMTPTSEPYDWMMLQGVVTTFAARLDRIGK